MPSFVSPFDSSSVGRLDDVTVLLGDPERVSPPPDPPIVTRPAVARHAGRAVVLLQVDLAGGELLSPTTATARRVELDPATPLPGGGTEMLEIAPLPFELAPVLGHLERGLPTFYLAPFDAAALEAADTFLARSAALATPPGPSFVGALFPDGAAVAPFCWLRLIRDAMVAAGDPDGAQWANLLGTLYAGTAHCRVLDHAGRPLAGAPFAVELRRDDDLGVVASRSVTLGPDSDLEAALGATPGSPASLFAPPAGRHVAVRWSGSPPPGDVALPVHAFYETGDSAAPGERLRVPVDSDRLLTLQVLELARWYSPLPPRSSFERFRPGSHVEPLVDGIPALAKLAEDLRNATGTGMGAHLAGWAFNEFALDPTVSEATIIDLARAIQVPANPTDPHGSVRLLATTFVTLRNPDIPATREFAVFLLFALTEATLLVLFLVTLGELETDTWVVFAWWSLPLLALMFATLFAEVSDFEGIVKGITRSLIGGGSDAVVEGVNDLLPDGDPPIAIFGDNPMRLEDNPLTQGVSEPLLGLEDDVDQFNLWHDKFQLVRRTAGQPQDEYVAYVGGMDINRNRFDSPSHAKSSPYHDVHARVTGGVVADFFASFHDRWEYARTRTGDTDAPPEEVPLPTAAALSDPRKLHIGRVGRTYYGPNPANPDPPFDDFAPDGDAGVYETLRAAIRSAQDYIYIEDQYFTPDDAFVDELVAAASDCARLLIVMPGETDQPFGDTRRRMVLSALRAGWGERMLAGFPQRRPVLKPSGRLASRGRCRLVRPCTAGDAVVILEPPDRVIEPPFWLWIEGELMLARAVTKPVEEDGRAAARVEVVRGGTPAEPRWGAHPRHHEAGAPATFSTVQGIYVHAKTMMVDDVFVSIGSANLNRRGFFSDGEINVFAIPQQLAAAADNPARALRCALWAEHLGIPPAMGPALVRDPTAAFELFRRPRFAGNRFAPLTASDVKPLAQVTDVQLWPMTILGAIALLIEAAPLALGALFEDAWNYVIDPTSFTDPAPTRGPV